MSNSCVLVDSSVWVDYFRGTDLELQATLRNLFRNNRVAINPVIRLEILTGAESESQYKRLQNYLKGLVVFFVDRNVYERAEKLRFRVRKQGTTIPVADILIASTALEFGCPLWHRDQHFEVVKDDSSKLRMFEV